MKVITMGGEPVGNTVEQPDVRLASVCRLLRWIFRGRTLAADLPTL